jgi:hypothetical protein
MYVNRIKLVRTLGNASDTEKLVCVAVGVLTCVCVSRCTACVCEQLLLR